MYIPPCSCWHLPTLEDTPKFNPMGPAGLFLWRMTDVGRHMLFNWHRLVTTGAVECHGYDQAALQIIVLNEHLRRQPGRGVNDLAEPYIACRQPSCGGGNGTNFKPGVSCNARYFQRVQQLLTRAGVDNPTGHELDNGLANHHFPLGMFEGSATPRTHITGCSVNLSV